MIRLKTLAFILSIVSIVAADEWPNWRGPSGNGVVNDNHEYATKWSADSVQWKVKLPEHGGSTPVKWKDRIFVTTPKDGQNTLMCLNTSGEVLWEKSIGKEVAGKHKKASGSNPSPVTDGRQVFVYFKSGDLAAFTTDGEQQWHVNLQDKYGKDTLWWDLGTSPVLTNEHVIVACIQSDYSYVAGFDRSTGEEAWKVDRNMDAPSEANQSYSTPVVVNHASGQQLVILGADHVTGHDATNGKELWRVGGLNPDGEMYFRSIASAAVGDNIAVAPYARGNTLTAIRMGGSGDVT
ncbi:MAG: PQQ-binding-like beta-propeller repeat protein, partial [Planctomycetales bacterium]|nr:PQQ-binding-like beta-propeller repeat protein [Planctomycetales bacterium]